MHMFCMIHHVIFAILPLWNINLLLKTFTCFQLIKAAWNRKSYDCTRFDTLAWMTISVVPKKCKCFEFSYPSIRVRYSDATNLTRDNSTRESWRQGHPDAKNLKLWRSAFFFPRYTFFLKTINTRLLWRNHYIFVNCQLQKSLFQNVENTKSSKASYIFDNINR